VRQKSELLSRVNHVITIATGVASNGSGQPLPYAPSDLFFDTPEDETFSQVSTRSETRPPK
jgi:hypothetical protein